MRALVVNVGCRLNQSEGDGLRAFLQGQGYELLDERSDEDCDLVIVNTCCVTQEAERTSVNRIRRAAARLTVGQARRPGPRLVVTGCLAEANPERVRSIPGVAQVLGIEAREAMIAGQTVRPGRSRALLKVQDGCDNRCSFCKVGTLRGKPRSKPPNTVVQEAADLVRRGYQEIVLVGLNLGQYGRDLGTSLARLLAQLDGLGRLFRLRLSSLEPEALSTELLETVVGLCASARLCPHLHIPLQSGDDRMLLAMNRRGTSSRYRALVERVAEGIPDVNIGTDVIAGFPGEDAPAFGRTRRLLEEFPFGYVHAFSYSRRAGTAAGALPDSVPRELKRERVSILRDIGRRKSLAFRARFVGACRMSVLVESHLAPGRVSSALSDNYIPIGTSPSVSMPGSARPGSLVRVRIDEVDSNGARGRVVEDYGLEPAFPI